MTTVEATFWNGEPCDARRVVVVVAENEAIPFYWARPFVGEEREAVEVRYGGRVFYLDDAAYEPSEPYVSHLRSYGLTPQGSPAGEGWRKVTEGHGSPQCSSRSLWIEPGSARER